MLSISIDIKLELRIITRLKQLVHLFMVLLNQPRYFHYYTDLYKRNPFFIFLRHFIHRLKLNFVVVIAPLVCMDNGNMEMLLHPM